MSEFILDRANFANINRHQPVSRTPYPFQKKAFIAMDNLKRQNPDGFASMLVLPTGGGKTYTSVHWIIKNYIDKGVKVLWVAHRSELLRQAAEAFFYDTNDETLPSRDSYKMIVISSEFGRSADLDKKYSDSDLVIASRQSICSGSNRDFYIKWAKGKGLKKDRKLLIVFDEAHHAAARSYRQIINMMDKYIPHVDILGLTATPFRTSKYEEGSLKNIFTTGSGIVYEIDKDQLIKDGILSNPIHTEITTNIDMAEMFSDDEIRRINRLDLTSLDEKSLKKLTENKARNNLIVNTYVENKKKYGKTIVFAIDVVNAIALNAMFKAAGVKSDYVVSALSAGMNDSLSTERNPAVIRDFKNGKIDVLINVNILTEGTDIPNIETVFLARPTTSKILMTQMIGRGLRGTPSGGTSETQIVYFIDNWRSMVDFVNPSELMSGEDAITYRGKNKKIMLRKYIQIADIERFAQSVYCEIPPVMSSVSNIIPYGIISCNYMISEDEGEIERSKELLVYDESAESYKKVLEEIPKIISLDDEITEQEIKAKASDLFFKYCSTGKYIGFSSESIKDIILSYLHQGEIPGIKLIADRVSLYDLTKELDSLCQSEEDFDKKLGEVWDKKPLISQWYDREEYEGLMHVYYNRLHPKKMNAPEFILPEKEDMDMGTLEKYYPQYRAELREKLVQNMEKDSEGYYLSAIVGEDGTRYRSKDLRTFEMDHIIPISKGGKTVLENLQMISKVENRKLGAKDKKK